MKKLICLLLALVMLLSLGACSSEEDSADKDGGKTPVSEDGAYLLYGTEDPTTVGTVSDPLDPQAIYSGLTYIPEMFYGKYSLGGNWDLSDSQAQKYLEEVGTMEISDDATHMDGAVIGTIPYRIEAGPGNLDHSLCFITSKNWARLSFLRDSGTLTTCMAAYEINGNTISFTPALAWEYDKESQFISYQMSDLVWTYDFSFSGPNLTLSKDGKSVTMLSERFASEDYFFQLEGYLAVGSPTFDGMDQIHFYSGTTASLNAADSHTYYGEAVAIYEDGLITMSWLDREGNKYTRQFVYFLCDFDGIVLVDRENTYLFTAEYFERSTAGIRDLVSYEEQSKLANLSDDQVAQITEKKENLLLDLAQAYADSGLAVTVDETTGEITLDSAVLFDVNSSEISQEGKEFLRQFIAIYCSVVFSEKYEGFVSQIMVEGHTDTSGSYELNLELSQARADSVKDYCLSDECGVDDAYLNSLSQTLCAVGYSYTDPVYDANGNVDMAASRRVAFRFLIDLNG